MIERADGDHFEQPASVQAALRQNWALVDAVTQSPIPGARASLVRMLQSIASIESQIRRDYSNRYPLELLQNAHDAGAEAGRVTEVVFWVTPNALLVSDEGIGFGIDEVEALTTLGRSSKRLGGDRKGTVGYKGVGFTSVLEITDQPQVISGDVRFYMDSALARTRLVEQLGFSQRLEIPARPFPFDLNDSDLGPDLDRVRELRERHAVTIVRLPFRAGLTATAVDAVLRSQLTPETLLFMPWIRSLVIRDDDSERRWLAIRSRETNRMRRVELKSGAGQSKHWLVAEEEFNVDPSLIARLGDARWEDVRHLTAGAAIPVRAGRVWGDAPSQPIHVYAPTDESLGRAFILHGDFFLRTDRRHIEGAGVPGEISDLVGRRSAQMLAVLAEATAGQGRQTLAALAPQTNASEFGARLGAIVDETLRSTRIVRSAGTRGLRRPPELKRLASGLTPEREAALSRILEPVSDLVRPGDDQGRAATFIDGLGSSALGSTDLARRVDFRHLTVSYERALELLGRWIATLDPQARRSVGAVLRQRSLIRTAAGRFRRPSEVYLKLPRSPRLPRWLEKEAIPMPRGRYAAQLFKLLEIPHLDGGVALQMLVEAMAGGRPPRTVREHQAALGLVEAVWQEDPSTLNRYEKQLGTMSVPAANASGRRREWVPAKTAYFGEVWTGSSDLRDLYGKLDQTEFLVQTRGAGSRRREFYEALGVADSPRMVPVLVTDGGPGYGLPTDVRDFDDYDAWRSNDRVVNAWLCADGHEYSGRRVEFQVLDRLEKVLNLKDIRSSTALARALAGGLQDRGRTARIACANSTHRRLNNKSAVGYQQWLLTNRAWVPVRNDPLGRTFCRMNEAWVALPERGGALRLPQARLSRDIATRIGLPTMESAGFEQLEASLTSLAEAFPELADAGEDVWHTADRLQKKLDSLTTQDQRLQVPPFASIDDSGRVWSRSPLFADLPGLTGIAGLTLLPIGVGRRLSSTYGLKAASTVVDISPRPVGIQLGSRRLTEDIKAKMLALIERKGAERESTAARLARLREIPVRRLSRTVRLGGLISTDRVPFLLRTRRDRLGRVLADADLYWSHEAQVDWLDVLTEVARHLGDADSAYMLNSFLGDPEAILLREHVAPSDIDVAAERLAHLRRRRAGSDDERDDTKFAGMDDPGTGTEHTNDVQKTVGRSTDGESHSGEPASTGAVTHKVSQEAGPVMSGHASANTDAFTFGTAKRLPARRTVERVSSTGRQSNSSGDQRESISMPRVGDAIMSDPEIEAKAMELVRRYGKDQLGATVEDVHERYLGWDLEFVYSDGVKDLVEVKGLSGEARFVITPNELRAAKTHDRAFVYLACNLRGPLRPRLLRFKGTDLGEELLIPASYWVDWQAMDAEEIPLTTPGSDPSR